MENMNLLCLSDFNETGIVAKAGEVRAFPSTVWERLVDSWPACWTVAPDDPEAEDVLDSRLAEIETEAIEAPAKDKMMHAPAKAKLHAKAARHRG